MKEVLALLIFIALLSFGWNQPFREHYARVFPMSATAKQLNAERAARDARQRAMAEAARNSLPATKDAAWMWNPARLDRNFQNPPPRP